MSLAELTRWAAFEQVYGPILPHERIDIGLSKLSYYVVSLLSSKRTKVRYRDFLPTYLRELSQRRPSSPDNLRDFFEGLAHADDRHADR